MTGTCGAEADVTAATKKMAAATASGGIAATAWRRRRGQRAAGGPRGAHGDGARGGEGRVVRQRPPPRDAVPAARGRAAGTPPQGGGAGAQRTPSQSPLPGGPAAANPQSRLPLLRELGRRGCRGAAAAAATLPQGVAGAGSGRSPAPSPARSGQLPSLWPSWGRRQGKAWRPPLVVALATLPPPGHQGHIPVLPLTNNMLGYAAPLWSP